jgi:hypothetical protein
VTSPSFVVVWSEIFSLVCRSMMKRLKKTRGDNDKDDENDFLFISGVELSARASPPLLKRSLEVCVVNEV